jgi:RsiW-degrading membrane proteinase PrsW (M82 family)
VTEEKLRIIRLHKRWADGLTLIWLALALLLLTGVHFVLDRAGVDAGERTAVIVLLATTVVIAAIWQAVGLGIARIHMLCKGIDLER